MFKHLYDCFAHWYHGGTIYFYSDPHFADPEMKGIRKGYIPDEEQIQRIRAKVGKNDTLIILGDIGDKEWLKKLRGYKVLILGNHDVGATTYQEYVDEVYEGALMISDKLILSHEPIDFPYALNIHGHCHALPHKYDDKHLNMCAEVVISNRLYLFIEKRLIRLPNGNKKDWQKNLTFDFFKNFCYNIYRKLRYGFSIFCKRGLNTDLALQLPPANATKADRRLICGNKRKSLYKK